jgi:hypothetical protein
MGKSNKDCCDENFSSLVEVNLKCKILKEVSNQKALLKTIHLNQKGHYLYYFIDCSNEPCKCYLLDIKSQVLHPVLNLLDDTLNELKEIIKSNEKKNKNKIKLNSAGV